MTVGGAVITGAEVISGAGRGAATVAANATGNVTGIALFANDGDGTLVTLATGIRAAGALLPVLPLALGGPDED